MCVIDKKFEIFLHCEQNFKRNFVLYIFEDIYLKKSNIKI